MLFRRVRDMRVSMKKATAYNPDHRDNTPSPCIFTLMD